ncbi:S8 family serine peptidase [Spirosoma sp. HMF4905]|uniref:S8 family serine peptidase n=1 Tax=Spirosoma arboris TaxID=2682092 RepID=A0A7K1SG54_9BACT|nr:S53 family peptidase [Spirosoma arboris]MVM32799.1 S8 family serine peptidase [Spirosoma arboris]
MSAFDQLVPLPGSEKTAPDAAPLDTLDPNEVLTVTIRIRRRQSLTPLVNTESVVSKVISRSEYASQYGADPIVIKQVEAFATAYDLSLVDRNAARRSVLLRGTVAQMQRAFGVALANYQMADGTIFRGRTGVINVPIELVDSIEGVFGLDNRPQAQAHFQVYNPSTGDQIAPRASGTSFTPPQLARLYNYPTGVTGKGQCIAIIELGGGFRKADITTYFSGLGLKAPSVVAVSVDGGHNAPSTADGADGEVMLDIEVAGGVAPGASIVVYFAPNTDQGFLDAITTAMHDTKYKPSVISISWGSAEKNWTPQALTSFNQAFQAAAALGITVCAAAGDTGSDDSVGDGKVHVDFPASSPYVLACGGTKLTASGNSVSAEVVWHESKTSATGGGISDSFDLPDYQQKSHVPVSVNDKTRVGRGVPDVAAVADPATGYAVRVDGSNLVIGGTSAVAPLMAGLIALINQQKGKSVGFIHPIIYANPKVFRDITQGNNSTATGNKGYSAASGWDACTGLGVADGAKLARALGSKTTA